MKNPVLVLGAVPRTATAIARSLHAHDIPVDVVATSSLEPLIRSRAIRYSTRIAISGSAGNSFIDDLRALIRKSRYDMLVAANDNALLAVVDHYDELQKWVPLATPPPQIAKRVLDKEVTLEIARGCGLRVPQSITIHSSTELQEKAAQLHFPLVMKPGEKVHGEEFKLMRFKDGTEIAKAFREPRVFATPMLLQENFPGEGIGIEVLIHGGECIAAFQHRRIKELPHTGGVGVVAISEQLDPDLVRSSLMLLSALEWEGVAMVEYRRDPVTKQAALMEVNGRYWGTLNLPIQAGVDFPFYHWQIMHGRIPRVPSSYTVGLRCRWTAGYVRRLRDIVLGCFDSENGRGSRQDLWSSFRDFGPSVKDFLWSEADPMPALFELSSAMRDLATADLRALRRWILPSAHVQIGRARTN